MLYLRLGCLIGLHFLYFFSAALMRLENLLAVGEAQRDALWRVYVDVLRLHDRDVGFRGYLGVGRHFPHRI